MQWGLLIDGVLVLLLLTTIGYCAVVNRRLGTIRDAQQAMQDLGSELSAATARAETGLNQLRAAAAEASERVEPLLQQAGTAATDLDMLCHRAKKFSDRLDTAIGGVSTAAMPRHKGMSKPKAGNKMAAKGGDAEPGSSAVAARSQSERALLEALKAARYTTERNA